MKKFKCGIFVLVVACFFGCGDDSATNSTRHSSDSERVSISVASEDDLPSCTDDREGSTSMLQSSTSGFVCHDRKWLQYDNVVMSEGELLNCTSSREGQTAFGKLENLVYECSDGYWVSLGHLLDESEDPSQNQQSSSSAQSSSSVASSSSAKSSSSVASSSTAKSCSSSDVILSSSNEESGSSIVSSSSAKSSSSVASNGSVKDGSKYDATAKTLTDLRDNQTYKTVTIGTQTWMAENLNYDYNEGTARSYCYENSADSCAKYGRLYLWSAAMDSAAVFSTIGKGCGYGKTCASTGDSTGSSSTSATLVRGVCPEGWHLPNDDEWNTLFTAVGGTYTAGTKLKSTSGWNNGYNGRDAFGFSALPAGFYNSYEHFFSGVGDYAYFWSSSEYTNDYAYGIYLNYTAAVEPDYNYKGAAGSVRCLLD